MITFNKLIYYIFPLLSLLFSVVSLAANAPASLAGKKITVTVPSKYYDMEWYVLDDGTKTWLHELEDG